MNALRKPRAALVAASIASGAAAFGAASSAITSPAQAQEATVVPVASDIENTPWQDVSAAVRDPRITVDTDCDTWSAPNVPVFASTYCLIQKTYALRERGAELDKELAAAEQLRACAAALKDIKINYPERAAPYVGKVNRDNACEVAAKLTSEIMAAGQAAPQAALN